MYKKGCVISSISSLVSLLGKISQNLSSTAVVIGALTVKMGAICLKKLCYFHFNLFDIIIRSLQEKLEQPVTGPPSPRDINNGDTAQNLSSHIDHLRAETNKLKKQLYHAQVERKYL